MLTFYEKNNFGLFACNVDKSPKVLSWKKKQYHLTIAEAERVMATGNYVGARLPKDYIVIDIDMNHKDKLGSKKPDGMEPFLSLCKELELKEDFFKKTLVVKTGAGGFHLYFKLPEGIKYETLSQKGLTESVDIRTHLGYVIASGTNGYSVANKVEPMELPEKLLDRLKSKAIEKAPLYVPIKMLPPVNLEKVLNKLDIDNFATNDAWQEMITACIATSGNSPDVLNILETWSKTDQRYAEDESIRKRIETFEPSGGITAATFIYILKKEAISKYLIDKIRMFIGAEFNITEKFLEAFTAPFKLDFSAIHDNLELLKSFYYDKNQTAGVELLVQLIKEDVLYSANEKTFYFFTSNRWQETKGILKTIFTVLLQAGQRYYSDVSKKKDADAVDCFNTYVNYIGAIATQQKFELALKVHPDMLIEKPPWDSPELEATLTLKDTVMDFKGEGIIFRKGLHSEYRRLFIDLEEKDFNNKDLPTNFRQFLKDVFPDGETRKTATYVLSTMLSGTGKFRKFHIWNGSGNNGKSALMNIMRDVIGKNRAVTYSPDILLSSKVSNSLTPELAILRGALVAFSSETEESKKVSEGSIKNLTGNETITANPKYQGMIEFHTTFQLVLATNFLPTFSAHDGAFIKRLLVLPFYTCFYETEAEKERASRSGSRYFAEAKDIQVITNSIVKEKAQILYYLAKRYQELEITIPESSECIEVKNHYISDNNSIVDMLLEVVEFDNTKGYFTPTKDIIEYYNQEQNTRYSSRFIVARIKEVFPLVANHSKRINGKLTRGLKNIRLIYGAYPEGYQGNFTQEEIDGYILEEAQF